MPSFIDCWERFAALGLKHGDGTPVLGMHDLKSIADRIDLHRRTEGLDPLEAAKKAVASHQKEVRGQLEGVYKQANVQQSPEQSGLGAGAATVTEQSGQAKIAPAAVTPTEPVPPEQMTPEQMTPEEFYAIPENQPRNSGTEYQRRNAISDALLSGRITEAEAIHAAGEEAAPTVLREVRTSEREPEFQRNKDIAAGKSFSAAAVEQNKITLPEGYTREGDLYVQKEPGQPLAAEAVQAAPVTPEPPAASTAPVRVTNQSLRMGELVQASQEAKWNKEDAAKSRLLNLTSEDLNGMSVHELNDLHADATRGIGHPYPSKTTLIKQLLELKNQAVTVPKPEQSASRREQAAIKAFPIEANAVAVPEQASAAQAHWNLVESRSRNLSPSVPMVKGEERAYVMRSNPAEEGRKPFKLVFPGAKEVMGRDGSLHAPEIGFDTGAEAVASANKRGFSIDEAHVSAYKEKHGGQSTTQGVPGTRPREVASWRAGESIAGETPESRAAITARFDDTAWAVADQVSGTKDTLKWEAAFNAARDNANRSIKSGKVPSRTFMVAEAKSAAGAHVEKAPTSMETPVGESKTVGSDIAASEPTPDKAAQLGDVHAAIDALPDKHKAIFTGREIDGNTFTELAKENGITERTARKLHEEAVGMLRKSLGPGAASALEQLRETSQAAQLTAILKGTKVSKNLALTTRGVIAASNALMKGKNAVVQATMRARAIARHLWDSYSKLPAVTDFTQAVGRWSGGRQAAARESYKLAEAGRQSVKNPITREAMVNWIQAGGDHEILKQRAAASKTKALRDGYIAATKLTEDEQAMANNFDQFYKGLGEEFKEAGILKNMLEDYVNQIWAKDPTHAAGVAHQVTSVLSQGRLGTTFKNAMQRFYGSYFEGEQNGKVPLTKDIANLASIYYQHAKNVIADRGFIKELTQGKASDGKPLVEPSGIGENVIESEGDKPGVTLITQKLAGVDPSIYRKLDHRALRDWTYFKTNPDKTVSLFKGDLWVHNEVYQRLKNTLSSSALMEVSGIKQVTAINSFVKQSGFSLSAFHPVQIGTHAFGELINPFKVENFDVNDPVVRGGLDHGLMISNHDAMSQFSDGLHEGGLTALIPGVGDVNARMNQWMFSEYIPKLTVKMYRGALENNMKRYAKQIASGKYSVEQVQEMTARQANAAFGSMNYRYMGRNPTLQHLARLIFIAPTFLESRIAVVGQALRPEGMQQRRTLFVIGASMYLGSRILNKLADDDYHWLDHPFSVLHGNREYKMRSIPGDLYEAIIDPRRFFGHRTSPAINLAVETKTGKDAFGAKATALDTLRHTAETVIPISLRSRKDIGFWEGMLDSLGLHTRKRNNEPKSDYPAPTKLSLRSPKSQKGQLSLSGR